MGLLSFVDACGSAAFLDRSSSDREAFLGLGPSVVAGGAVECAVVVGSFHQEVASSHLDLAERHAVAGVNCLSVRSDQSS